MTTQTDLKSETHGVTIVVHSLYQCKCGEQQSHQMLLHASSISFTDQNGDTVEISARLHPEFERMKIALKFL
jgi:hypothetical protein